MHARRQVFYITISAALFAAGPGIAGQKPFAEYWVPQSDGEIILSYLISKRKIGPDTFAVTYNDIDIDKRGQSVRKNKASVNCQNNSINTEAGLLEIDPRDRDASMNTISAENLWWLVCRGVQEKFRPHVPTLD